ncbi:MAG: S41 family peptidase [Muribaculaceae bacterium]|jgi:carboxyl-terminal processing protease|nr:S41 family peptidase [Muribaculaceae bacterium]
MSKDRKYLLALPLVAAAFMVIGLWTGFYFSKGDDKSDAREKLDEVFSVIEEHYVEPVSFDSLVEMALPELLANLDPHSSYFAKSEREAANRDLEGSFFGIGIQFQMLDDTLNVIETIAGAAADEAGMLPGDRIIEVDGKNIAGNQTSEKDIFSMLRGPEGTEVNVKVKRSNSVKPLSFDLIRTEVPVSPIDASYLVNDTIGYIRLGKFADNTYSEFLQALAQLRYDGAKAYIIDLRGNGGGYMNPSVLISNEFLPAGKLIVMTKGLHAIDNSVLFSDGSGSFANENIVVLVDEFTASSSEIFAGAMQDNDRGLIIGRRTFGKGLVQRSFELPDSSEMRLTVQRYYTPSGRCIQKTYKAGHNGEYETEIFDRYDRGEIFSADSVKVDSTLIFHTTTGRPVYGGGGIIPDIFVPSDTSGVTNYYIKVANAGLLRKFAYEYADLNRDRLNESRTTNELLNMLPSDNVLLQSFVNYAQTKGKVTPRPYYINISAPLIVNQIKALIARDIVGMDGYFEIINSTDPVMLEAIRQLETGGAAFPLTDKENDTSNVE